MTAAGSGVAGMPAPGGTAGSAIAGSGGAGAGAAGNAGAAGATPSGGGFIREADPTATSVTSKGEYSVKSYTERDGLVGGDAYGAAALAGDQSELYYPEGATPPFAAVVIVPGFTAQRSDVAPWGPFLASHGVVALVIDTNTTSDTPDIRAAGLLDALESLKKENMRSDSPVAGKIDVTHLGLMGWSMGGGGTWLSADKTPSLKMAISLCGWLPGGSASKTTVPSLQFASLGDPLAGGMSQPIYESIPDGTPKMLIEFPGGDHWLANNPDNASKQIGKYGLSWVKVFLEGDERYRQFLKEMPEGTTDFKTNQQ